MNPELQVKQTLKKIGLKQNERVLVAVSGGKDSGTTAYLLKKFGYDVEGIHISLSVGDYSDKCLKTVRELCEQLEIKLYVYDFKKEQGKGMKHFWKKNKNLNHCAVCGVFKKWILNKESKERGFGKIATGHNLDDEAETFLLNVFKGSLGLGLKSGVITKNIKDKKFVPRIKPLFYLENKEVREFAKKKKIPFVEGVCPYREDSYRIQVRSFVKGLTNKEKKNLIKNSKEISKKFKRVDKKINYCKICGEPSMRNVCKKCEMVR